MSTDLAKICEQLIAGTESKIITWIEASSRSGFITATSKGSIKLEKSDYSDEYSLKFLDNNGILLDEMGIRRDNEELSEYKILYDTIRKQIYNVDEKVKDILSELGKQPNFLDIESVFPGTWKNDYKFKSNDAGSEILQIKDGKYFIQGRHWFNIQDFSINYDKSEISFLKVGLTNDLRRLRNKLKVIKLGEKYEGIETDDIDKNIYTSIIYSRIS